jgi:hypothetical protein
MALWNVYGQVVDDSQEGARIPEGAVRLPEYRNVAQYGADRFWWDPSARMMGGRIEQTSPGYLTTLLDYRNRVRTGQAKDYEAEEYRRWEEQARAIPTRDIATLTAGWQGEREGQWGEGGWQPGNADWWTSLDPGSPDVGPIMLQIQDRMQAGTATPQERQLYGQVYGMAADWDYRASVPQASDASAFGLGDQLFGALSMLGLGAGAGAALAPLYAGAGLTLGTAGGLAGTAGSMSGMFGEALDQDWLRKAGISLGAAGGLAGIGSLLSQGISSIGDVLSLGQKAYGAGSKVVGLAQGAGSTPDTPRAVGSRSSASSASDTPGSAGGGGGMDFTQLGSILSGIVGAVGSKLSLDDASRYMNQLKAQFGDQQATKDLIDQAYRLAAARYDTFYAQTQQEQQQKQEAYQDALEKYQTHYQQTQQEQGQRQAAYAKGEGQIDEDRATQYENFRSQRAKYDDAYNKQVQEAAQDRDRKITVFGEDRGIAMADYNRRVAEAQQDRQKEYATFDQQFARHMSTADKRDFEAAQERGLDLNAYMQRQAIGANLANPAAIKAGAEAIYQPLSTLARENISRQAQAEMAMRGVSGGAADLMSAKAFAPQEQALWQNALQAYLSGQQGAANAYSQQDMTMTPQYQWTQVPNFTDSPNYTYTTVPNMGGTPTYAGKDTPTFSRTSTERVPGTVALGNRPNVQPAVSPGTPPRPDQYSPTPYKPYEGRSTGVNDLVTNLVKALGLAGGAGGAGGVGGAAGGIIGLIKQIFGGGGTNVPASFLSWGGDETQQPWYDPQYLDYGNYESLPGVNWGEGEADFLPIDTSQWDWTGDW